jgi:hypothetical protein
MQIDILERAPGLSAAEVLAGLQEEVRSERAVAARVVAWLVEIEQRKLWAAEGYSSLFAFCVGALGFSEDETCNRSGTVRAVIRYPFLLGMLAARTLTMTAVRLLYPHLDGRPDARAVLESAAGRSRRDIEVMIAGLSPKPDAATILRRLPAPVPSAPMTPLARSTTPLEMLTPPPDPAPVHVVRAAPPALVAPLSPDRYRLQVTMSGEAVEKLRLAEDMLSHAVPAGDAAAVLERALDALLEELARRKFSATEDPRPGRAPADGSRTIPAAVKREVWIRDLGRCTFVSVSGHRCEERRLVQFHHLHPFGLGGPSTAENIVLLCAAHNQYAAELDYGQRRNEYDSH